MSSFVNFGGFDSSPRNYLARKQERERQARQVGQDIGSIGAGFMDLYKKQKAQETMKDIMDAWDYQHDSEIPDPEYQAALKQSGMLTEDGQELDEDIIVNFDNIFDDTLSLDDILGEDETAVEEIDSTRPGQKMGEIVLDEVSTKDWAADTMKDTLTELQDEVLAPEEVDPELQAESDFNLELAVTQPDTKYSVMDDSMKFYGPEDEEKYKKMRSIFGKDLSEEQKYRRAAALLTPYDPEGSEKMMKYAEERSRFEIEEDRRKQKEDKFIKREESYNSFAITKDDYINAIQSYQRGEISLEKLNESYRTAEGAKSKALGTGVPSSNLGLKSPLDFARQEDKDKIETSKIARDAVNMVNGSIKNAKQDGNEFIKKYTEVKKSKGLVADLRRRVEAGNVSPKELFAAVKSLAAVIEPGLSVTEGEVDAYLGETDASQFIINASAWGGMLDDLIGRAGSQATKRVVDKNEVLSLLTLADKLSNGVMGTYRNAAIGGKDKLIRGIKSDIDVSYSNVLGDDKYQKLINEVENKYDAAFGLVQVKNAKSDETANPAAPKQTTPQPKPKKGPKKGDTKQGKYGPVVFDGKNWVIKGK